MKNKIKKFNEWLALKITLTVGTMWSAYLFTAMILFAMVYPPVQNTIFFISSAFLQLVFLPIIMVGQDVQTKVVQTMIQKILDTVLQEFGMMKEIIIEVHKQNAIANKQRTEGDKQRLENFKAIRNLRLENNEYFKEVNDKMDKILKSLEIKGDK